MRRPVTHVPVKHSVLLLVALLLITGCDVTSGTEPNHPPAAYSFEVDFVLNDLHFAGTIAAATYDAPEFTSDVVNDGAVLAYFRDLENMWTAMPFTYGVESDEQPAVDYTATLAYAYERNHLDIFLETSSDDEFVHDAIRDASLFQGPLPIKIVVIPGGRYAMASMDSYSYESVKAEFDLD